MRGQIIYWYGHYGALRWYCDTYKSIKFFAIMIEMTRRECIYIEEYMMRTNNQSLKKNEIRSENQFVRSFVRCCFSNRKFFWMKSEIHVIVKMRKNKYRKRTRWKHFERKINILWFLFCLFNIKRFTINILHFIFIESILYSIYRSILNFDMNSFIVISIISRILLVFFLLLVFAWCWCVSEKKTNKVIKKENTIN